MYKLYRTKEDVWDGLVQFNFTVAPKIIPCRVPGGLGKISWEQTLDGTWFPFPEIIGWFFETPRIQRSLLEQSSGLFTMLTLRTCTKEILNPSMLVKFSQSEIVSKLSMVTRLKRKSKLVKPETWLNVSEETLVKVEGNWKGICVEIFTNCKPTTVVGKILKLFGGVTLKV